MDFIDLKSQYNAIKSELHPRLQHLFERADFIQGDEVAELESSLCSFVDSKYCITVANGSDALLIALMALGVKSGDEVIVPNFTFIAPAEAVLMLGARLVFVDIEPQSYNLDPDKLAAAVSEKTKAIIAVSLYGQCADFDRINMLAEKYGIPVIEDAAQSFGATYKEKKSANLTTIAITSFFPSKPLGCYGDGGACFTNDTKLAEVIRIIANHGQKGRYNHIMLGFNSRLDTLQAIILLAKLTIFEDELVRRRELAAIYSELLHSYVMVPHIEPFNNSVFAQYTIASEHRDKIKSYLEQHTIPSMVHYPLPLNEQQVFRNCWRAADDLSNSKLASKQVLSLPFSPYLLAEDAEKVAGHVIKALK